MSIHPLTRIDRDAAGRLWIICHLEMRDAWGDAVKGAGQLELELYRPPPAAGGSVTGPQELTWDVDLSNLENNASLYDQATRTYRLPLRNAPEWLAEAPAPGAPIRGILRAVFTTSGPQAEGIILEHEFQLQ